MSENEKFRLQNPAERAKKKQHTLSRNEKKLHSLLRSTYGTHGKSRQVLHINPQEFVKFQRSSGWQWNSCSFSIFIFCSGFSFSYADFMNWIMPRIHINTTSIFTFTCTVAVYLARLFYWQKSSDNTKHTAHTDLLMKKYLFIRLKSVWNSCSWWSRFVHCTDFAFQSTFLL